MPRHAPSLLLTAIALLALPVAAQTLGKGGSLATGGAGADFALSGSVLGKLSAAGGGYGNTNEGKLIVGSFLDNWNNIVRNVPNNPSLVQARAGAASQRNAAEGVRANAGAPGGVVFPKINGVKVLRQPRDGSGEVQSLTRNDEVLLNGEEMNGYVKVTTSRGEGWVKAILLGSR